MPSDNPDISGVWRLRAFFLEDVQTSKRFEPFGPNPRGALIMHPEGRMVAVITPAERGAPTTETGASRRLPKADCLLGALSTGAAQPVCDNCRRRMVAALGRHGTGPHLQV